MSTFESGAELIAAERSRHPELGWDAEHDKGHDDDLERAASCYLNGNTTGPTWPWEMRYWKPKSRLLNMVRAGALVQAAFEAIDPFDNSDHAYFCRKRRPERVATIARMIDRYIIDQEAQMVAWSVEREQWLAGSGHE